MKNPLPLAAALALLSSAAVHSAPVAAQPQPAALEIQISSSLYQGKEYFSLGIQRPVLLLIIRNVSSKPVQLVAEKNSLGFNNIHLEITIDDGKTLPKPIIVARGEAVDWRSNVFITETLAPNQAIVREIRLHVPAAIAHPITPPTQEEIDDDKPNFNNSMKGEYFGFPLPTGDDAKTITMKAVYASGAGKGAWSGRVDSPLLTYEFHRYTFGY